MKMLNDTQKTDLEAMIDSCGLANVLETLGEIAHEKGDHVSSTWQDGALAVLWHFAAKVLTRAAQNGNIKAVSK